jgi:hypothetical protein
MAAPKSPYLFLYARCREDAKLVLAGWEATQAWPHVLCLLKESRGILSDDEVSPEYFAAIYRCPLDFATAAMDGLKRTGLLVKGTRKTRGGPNGSTEIEGWITPKWDKWAIDKRNSVRERSRPFDTVTSDNGTERPPNGTERPTNGGGIAHLDLDLELELENKKKRASRPVFSEEVLMLWGIYVEEQAKVGIKRRGKPTKPIADPMRSVLREYTAEDVESVIRWAHTSDHQRATFLRSNNNLGKTLFRPSNFSEYLAFAESAEPAPPSKPLSFEDEQRRRRGGRTFEELDAEWRVEWKLSEAELVAEYAPERVPRQVENDHVQHWWVAERELRGIT